MIRRSTIALAAALALAGGQPRAQEKAPDPKSIQAWLRQLGDEDAKKSLAAIDALIRTGPPAVPALGRALKSKKPAVRRNAAYVLAEIGPGAREAVAALGAALQDPDREVRRNAAETLAEIGLDAKEAVPGLIGGLKDTDREVRRRCAAALAEIGADAQEAVPALVKALKDPEVTVR